MKGLSWADSEARTEVPFVNWPDREMEVRQTQSRSKQTNESFSQMKGQPVGALSLQLSFAMTVLSYWFMASV